MQRDCVLVPESTDIAAMHCAEAMGVGHRAGMSCHAKSRGSVIPRLRQVATGQPRATAAPPIRPRQPSATTRQAIAAAKTQRNASAASVSTRTATAGRPRIEGHPPAGGPESGDDEGRAKRAKEVHRAGRNAQLMQRYGVLHHHDRKREQRAHAQAGGRNQAECDGGRKPGRRDGQGDQCCDRKQQTERSEPACSERSARAGGRLRSRSPSRRPARR